MAKIVKTKSQKKYRKDEVFPFERENYVIMATGLLVIVVGYIALMGETVEGFFPLVLAPILLVLGYCVIIPVGILYRKKPKESSVESAPPSP